MFSSNYFSLFWLLVLKRSVNRQVLLKQQHIMDTQNILINYTYPVEDLIKFILQEDTPLLEANKGYTVVSLAVVVLLTGANLINTS